jgi:predicted membrane chloride channel (bestrophin family)
MKGYWVVRGLKIALVVALGLIALSVVVMALWNWVVPAVIGWKAIDFSQALGLLVLSRILFGFRMGFGYRGHWRGRMAERWARMSAEEREKFSEGMRARCGSHRHSPSPLGEGRGEGQPTA